jgi:succinyl-diaminopimelate desuccinylase
MSDVLALTKDLVARRSVTPDDAGCQELIATRWRRPASRSSTFHSAR